MSMVYHALQLYGTCAREAGAAARRSGWAVAFLIVAFSAQFLAALALRGFGIAGSLVLGFLQSFLVGWYLSLVRRALLHKRPLSLAEVRERAGDLFRETLSVLFLFSIGSFLLQLASPLALLVAVPVACIAFNATPEVLAQGRTAGLEVLGDSWAFLRPNWPEWIVPQIGAVALAAGAHAWLTAGFDPADLLLALELFGPWFGFMTLPAWGAGLGLPLGVVAAAVLGLFAHGFMLFRAALYQRLASGSRRGRAFQARAAGR